jgi:hypothetical protein
MFKRRTVFIVGAGASREVNFPMGAELTGIIASKLNIQYADGWRQSNGDAKIVDAVKAMLSADGERDPNPHFNAGRAISGAMSQAISIDNYLHTHSNDRFIVQMGKLGIASSILEAEAKSLLKPDPMRNDSFSFDRVKDTWFNAFFQMLHEGVQRELLPDIFANVSFITFNYDRCIEHYLAHAISNYYRVPLTEAEEIVGGSLRIVHPYGQVGRLPWQRPRSDQPIRFGHDFRGVDLVSLSEQIRTFTERVDDEDMLHRMHEQIEEAEVVVYLGFSYNEMNMQLMAVQHAGQRKVFGTTYGMSAPAKTVIDIDVRASMRGSIGTITDASFADLKCADFLRDYSRPILRG